MKTGFYYVALVIPVWLGWYSPRVFERTDNQTCSVNSVVIYNEQNSRVVNSAHWFSEADGENYRYSAHVSRTADGGMTDHFTSERTIRLVHDFRLRYVSVETRAAFRISGPETGHVWPGAYIDPLAEKGFTASVYLFRAGDRWIQGFQGRPRALCNY
jgi:hypothetical protein